jgi:G3E family GTPase
LVRSRTAQQIPVVVLAGFLGSGKTTLLNHLLHRSRGSRIGALVNDFGAIEIDAMAVAGALGDSTVSLGNGCLCCAVDASELDQYLERLAAPAAGLDVIVIEASGLAEPQELVRMVLASELPGIVYGGLVEVVDAAEFDATRARHPEIDRHLALADLVVVNKLDRVAEPDRLVPRVRELAPRAAVVPAVHGRIDPEFLFDCRPGEERLGQLSFDDLHEHDDHAGHLHTGYDSVSFVSGQNRYAVHAVGSFLRFYPEPWAPGEERLTQLVLIGSGIDAPALGKELEACRSDAPHADEHGMWGVLRYVQGSEDEPEDPV